jgi:hypothetical protein
MMGEAVMQRKNRIAASRLNFDRPSVAPAGDIFRLPRIEA